MVIRDYISPSSDQKIATVVTIGVITVMTGDIAGINIMDAGRESQFAKFLKRGYGCGWDAIQLVAWKKSDKMQWIIGTEIVQDPSAHLFYHLGIIHITRNTRLVISKCTPCSCMVFRVFNTVCRRPPFNLRYMSSL